MKRLLVIEYPELSKEWSDKNKISVREVTVGSHNKVWWKGTCGHEWEAIVKNRVNGSGCPYCSGNRVLLGFNDLATLFPKLVREWDEDNYPLMPEQFVSKSNKEITWVCKNGHKWKARIADRTDGHGCPRCAKNNMVDRTLYELFKRDSGLFELWSEKNEISLKESSGNQRRVYWWKCRRCGEDFKASIRFIKEGAVCPSCRKEDSEKRYQDFLESRKINRSRRFRLPAKAFEYYATMEGLSITKDDDSMIGIPFQFFLPKFRAAIEFSDQRDYMKQHHRNNEVKNDLCLRTQIKMIRILESSEDNYRNCLCISRVDDSYDGISESLQTLFGILHIDIDVDVERDIDRIINA